MDAALTDQKSARGHMSGKRKRGFEGDFESGEITVIDANQVGAAIDRGVQFATVVNFNQSAQPMARRNLPEIANLSRGQDSGDQQDRIRAVCRGFEYL